MNNSEWTCKQSTETEWYFSLNGLLQFCLCMSEIDAMAILLLLNNSKASALPGRRNRVTNGY